MEAPDRRRKPIACMTQGCANEVWAPSMGACDTCFRRLWRAFWYTMGVQPPAEGHW